LFNVIGFNQVCSIEPLNLKLFSSQAFRVKSELFCSLSLLRVSGYDGECA
jgi:hypothetical protein